MKNRYNYLFLLLLLIAAFQSSFGQIQKSETFVLHDVLGERNFINATQNDNLIIYFNSDEGILSFDGKDFSMQPTSLAKGSIYNLYAQKSKLFLSTENETYILDTKNDSLQKILDEGTIQFQETKEGLWLLSSKSLYLFSDNKISVQFRAEDNEQFNCFSVSKSQIIVGHSKGLTLKDKENKIQKFGTFLSPDKIVMNEETAYILSNTLIFTLDDGKLVQFKKSDKEIKDFFLDDFGRTWLINADGKLLIDDGIFTTPFITTNVDENTGFEKLFKDKEDNLWALGDSKLLKITSNNEFSRIAEKEVKEVFSGKSGTLVLTKNQLSFYSLNFKKQIIKLPIPSVYINEIQAFEVNNREWVISLDNSVYIWQIGEGNLRLIKKNSEYIPILASEDGEWLAKNSDRYVFLIDQQLNPIRDVGNFRATKIISTPTGYSLLNAETKKVYSSDSLTQKAQVLTIADSIDFKNLRPHSKGFWYFENNRIFNLKLDGDIQELQLSHNKYLENRTILNLFSDNEEGLWIATDKYLFRVPISVTETVVETKAANHYSSEDFLYSPFFYTAHADFNGMIWFVSQKGISIYDPLKELPNLVAPGIIIKNAYALTPIAFSNFKDSTKIQAGKLRVQNNAIVIIEPKTINHFNNHKTKIVYRNISTNEAPTIIDIGEKIVLTDLQDGLNAISIRAINKDGVESLQEQYVNISVMLPFWKKNWFYLTIVLLILLLSFIGYRTVISIKNNRSKELEDELQKGLEDLEKRSHLQVLKAERLKQLNELITSQKGELEKKNTQIESQKYELSLTNQQIKKQKDLLEETSSKLKSSINYAKRIQNALMSTEIEIKNAFDNSFVYFQPRDVVSGDFFWFSKAENEKGEALQILAAVDCTGHGVPGAIVSVVGMNILNNITKLKKIYDPGQILTEMNLDIISDLRQDETQVNDGMDMSIITYNTHTRQLYFAGAKNPLMYVEDNELIRIKGDKYAIGGQQRGRDRDFETHKLDLTDGKVRSFYLFSDGYSDQFGGEKGFKYLTKNFKDLLVDIHDKDVLDQKTILHEELERWKDGYSQTDDILVIGLKL